MGTMVKRAISYQRNVLQQRTRKLYIHYKNVHEFSMIFPGLKIIL